MDSDKCQALVRVVELGNIHAAAADLGYTPSGVSRMMASLEAELGVTLLLRSKKGVRPTDACLQLLPSIKRMAMAGEALAQAADDCRGLAAGTVRVGVAYPQYFPELINVLTTFRAAYPGISIAVREANSTPLATMLTTGDLDLAVMSYREGDFCWSEVIRDQLVALVPQEHPLAGAREYPLARFESDSFVETSPGEGTDNARVFARYGITPNTQCSVSDYRAGTRLVEAGLGVALCNRLLTRELPAGVVALPTQPAVNVPIGIAYARPDVASPAAAKFIDSLLAQLEVD